MEPGKIVAFFEQKRILCAVCLEVKGNRVHLLRKRIGKLPWASTGIVQSSLFPNLKSSSSPETLPEI